MSGIWTATRGSPVSGFGPPQSLGLDGYSPSISGDGLTLYFVSLTEPKVKAMTRPSIGGLWGPPQDVYTTNYTQIDISGDELHLLLSDGPYMFLDAPVAIAHRASKTSPFGAPEPIDVFEVVGDGSLTKSASWSADERRIYVEMELPTGQGATDIYVSTCE